jgi:hypothetical protein
VDGHARDGIEDVGVDRGVDDGDEEVLLAAEVVIERAGGDAEALRIDRPA